MRVFFPAGWDFQMQDNWLKERGLKSMGSWTLKGFYHSGVRDTPSSEIVWSLAVWTPE